MNIIADTNILVRAATLDDPVQGPLARSLMADADLIAIALPALCEFCWVLRSIYRLEPLEVAASLRMLLDAGNVAMDRQAVEAGLEILEAGGDFADGIIAHDGQWLGGETFVSFDQKAVRRLSRKGVATLVPG